MPAATKYWLQVSKDGNFPANNLQVNDSTITETSYNMTVKGKVLEEGVTYYWRLKSINQYYVQSDWAMSYQFTVHSNKPASPTLKSPSDKGTVTTTSPELTWSQVPAATKYWLQVSKDGNFPANNLQVNDSTITETSYNMTVKGKVLEEGITYYWQIKSINEYNVKSEWATRYQFTVHSNKPASPTLKSPSDKGTVTTTSPELTWSQVPAATKYWLQVSKDGNFPANNLQVNDSTITETSYNMTVKGKVLEEGVTYYWRLKSINQYYVQSDWAMSYQFTVHSNKPASPTLKSPSDKGTVTTTFSPELTWSQVPAATKYWLQVSKDGNFPANNLQVNDSTITETSYNMTAKGKVLEEGVTYYWRLKSINQYYVQSDWAMSYQFTVHSNKPASPTLKSPSDKGTVTTTSPELTWSQVPAATKYWLQVSKDGNFPANNLQVNDSTITETSYNMTAKGKVLEEGVTYYWQIKSINEYDVKSEWATRYQFSVFTMGITELSPDNQNENSPQVIKRENRNFTWIGKANAAHYISFDIRNTTTFETATILGTPRYVASGLSSYTLDLVGYDNTLQDSTSYCWRVQEKNPDVISSTYFFTFYSDTLIKPPIMHTSDNINASQIEWEKVAESNELPVLRYEVQISQLLDWKQVQTFSVHSSLTSLSISNFSIGEYYWRIRAVYQNTATNEIQRGPWSLIRKVNVQ